MLVISIHKHIPFFVIVFSFVFGWLVDGVVFGRTLSNFETIVMSRVKKNRSTILKIINKTDVNYIMLRR